MYFISITIVIVANILYSIFQNIIPNEINPIVALCCMYIGGIVAVLPFFLKTRKKYKKQHFNKRVILFSITNIILDLGFLLAFRYGWEISYFNIVSNITILIILTITGILFFKEKLTLINILGIFIGITGLVILNL